MRFWALISAGLMTAAAMAQDRSQPGQDRPGGAERQMQDEDKPGAQHRHLDVFTGTWNVTGQCMKDESQTEAVRGTAEAEWVLDKHFVKTTVKLTEGGDTIEGIAMCGYDNNKQKFVSTWQDSECTGIKMDKGEYDPGTKTFTYTGEYEGEDGKKVQCRRVVKIKSDIEHTMTSYITEPGKGERKVAELTFKKGRETAGRS